MDYEFGFIKSFEFLCPQKWKKLTFFLILPNLPFLTAFICQSASTYASLLIFRMTERFQ